MIFHPTFLGQRDPHATIVIEVTLLAGRSDEQKERLYKDMRCRLAELGFEPRNSRSAISWRTARLIGHSAKRLGEVGAGALVFTIAEYLPRKFEWFHPFF